jgi:phospho-N-acetylmuramoyl-pentapeptide-transferase
MLYYLFDFLDRVYDVPGAGVFRYISFRSAMAVLTSLVISLFIGRYIIRILKKYQVEDAIRDLGLDGQQEKQGTPTMGGLIIIGAIVVPTLLFAKLHNIYIIIMLIATLWMGAIGFVDDYIKVFKKDKKGLAARFKLIGQVGLGIIVGTLLFFSEDVVVREPLPQSVVESSEKHFHLEELQHEPLVHFSGRDVKSTRTTIPFLKNNEFDYAMLLSFLGDRAQEYAWIVFIPVVILIITAVSNGANITDGIDGLATGTAAIIGSVLGVFAYVSGNIVFAKYLNIMYIPNTGELVVFMSAFVGACVGFLWYNSYPAQIFMGDTGSLAMGGIIASYAIAVRKELLLPLICGIFLIETLSVMMQVAYFKYTRKKYGQGRRIFLMSPLHHHYQKAGYHEAKIVTRFWIVGIFLAVASIVTLKLR